jgi:hypothetical protein
MITSFAPRAFSFRLAASMTMMRNVPVALRVSPRSRRSMTWPARSRPSRREPSHSAAASCASRQLRDSWIAPPAHVRGGKFGSRAGSLQGSCIEMRRADCREPQTRSVSHSFANAPALRPDRLTSACFAPQQLRSPYFRGLPGSSGFLIAPDRGQPLHPCGYSISETALKGSARAIPGLRWRGEIEHCTGHWPALEWWA